jgi:dephospho-CoA kinase
VPVLGLTGGIATGKSTFSQSFLRLVPECQHFDADRCVHDLLSGDISIREKIRDSFGTAVLGANGFPNREKLRDVVFGDSERRKTLESILHPEVRRRWEAQVATHRESGKWLLVDIPLMYETGVQAAFDRIIVVASPRATQLKRLILERGLALGLAERILYTQLDIAEKTRLADHVIWNDSTVSNLDGQSEILAAWLKRHCE